MTRFIAIKSGRKRSSLFRLIVVLGVVLFCLPDKVQAQRTLGGGFQQGNGSFQQGSGNQANSPFAKPAATPQTQRPRRPAVRRDTIVSVIPDSLRSPDSQMETTVDYSANDSTILDVDAEIMHLYGDAVVIYGDVELKADYIQLNWGKGEMFAHGMPDTTKQVGEKVRGKPMFSQGADAYTTDTIRYNFKSKRAIIKNIITQQGDGIIHGERVKKDSVDNLYLVDAMYTTCNLPEPHFHISADKIKLVNKRNVVSGPFNLVVADIPLPIGLPFGFFPVPKDKEIGTSGFIMGQYGEEPRDRGFYFRDFGYYFAISKYIGVKVLGQVFSHGSWGAGVQSNYVKRYRYGGNLNLQYNRNKPGSILDTSDGSKDFNVSWSHSPQSRRSDRSFAASVNLRSNGYDRRNRNLQELQNYTAATSNSSINGTRNFGNFLRTSAGISANQNFTTKVLNLNASYNVGLNQFNPFVKEEDKIGRWWEGFRMGVDIRGGYQATNDISSRTRSTTYTDYKVYGVENKPLTEEEMKEQAQGTASYLNVIDLGSKGGFKDMFKKTGQFRNSFSVPIALPNFKVARFINITPSVSYQGDIYTKKLNYSYFKSDTIYLNKYTNKLDTLTGIDPKFGAVVIDTTSGVFSTYNVSTGLSMNTRVYGTYQFGSKGRLQAIRHTVAPSVSFSYTPDLKKRFFQETQVRADEDFKRWMPNYTGLTSTPGASGVLGFNLTNQLEAKLRAKTDTAAKQVEKISLLDNFSISGSYNLLGALLDDKEQNEGVNYNYLSNINFGANTQIFKDLINLNAGATLDPYAYEADSGATFNLAGKRTRYFKWQTDKYSGTGGDYFSGFNVSISTRLSPDTFNKNKSSNKPTSSLGDDDPATEAMRKFVAANPMAYVDFSVPWSLNFSFNMNYSRQGLAARQLTKAMQITGDFSLTPKWKFNFSTGYDFNFKAVTLTNLGVIRDLHCWDMSFNWTPIAGNTQRASSYSFTLNVRSALLRDLKISRRRQYYDIGGF